MAALEMLDYRASHFTQKPAQTRTWLSNRGGPYPSRDQRKVAWTNLAGSLERMLCTGLVNLHSKLLQGTILYCVTGKQLSFPSSSAGRDSDGSRFCQLHVLAQDLN